MKQDEITNNATRYDLNKPVFVIAVTDVVGSRTFKSAKALDLFCTSFRKKGTKGTGFAKISQKGGDSFSMPLKSGDENSTQESLEQIHTFSRHYLYDYRSSGRRMDGDMPERLDVDRFFHCGVCVGSIAPGRNDPNRNLGFVYIASYDAMMLHKSAVPINDVKSKAVFKSLFEDSLDVIMNWSEMAISLMLHQRPWQQHREAMIELWDKIVLLLRKELRNKGQWIKADYNLYKFVRSETLDTLVKELTEKCIEYFLDNQRITERYDIVKSVTEGYRKYSETDLLIPQEEKQTTSFFSKMLSVKSFFKKNIKKTMVNVPK